MKLFYKGLILFAIVISFQSCIVCYYEPEKPREHIEVTHEKSNLENTIH